MAVLKDRTRLTGLLEKSREEFSSLLFIFGSCLPHLIQKHSRQRIFACLQNGILSIATYVIGFILGLKRGSGAFSPASNSIPYAFFLSDVFPVWAASLILGTILLGFSEIIGMLEEKMLME